jgi:hypothetical protein
VGNASFSRAMKLAVVDPANRDSEFVAHSAADRTWLRKGEVVRVRWPLEAPSPRLAILDPMIIGFGGCGSRVVWGARMRGPNGTRSATTVFERKRRIMKRAISILLSLSVATLAFPAWPQSSLPAGTLA